MSTPTKGSRRHVKFERKPGSPRKYDASPSSATSRTPDLQVSGTNHRMESRSRIWFLVGIVAIAGMVAGAVALNAEKDDPHFVKARDSVRDYEQGKPADRRNYTNPLYQEALDELALVSTDSISADPAKALADDIRLGIRDFEARQQKRQRLGSSAVTQKEQRRRAIINSIEQERANPQVDYPDCEDEEADDHGHPDS